jgi:lysophospholipase L1-like esterase
MISEGGFIHQKSRIMNSCVQAWFVCVLLSLTTACGEAPKLKALAPNDVIVAYGDSLTYGTGVSAAHAYPAVLQALIGRSVINAGVPGETTEEALKRLPAVLEEYHPKLVILCTGGNDMLRKLDMDHLQVNVRQMIKLIQAQQAQVILIGVPTPTLFGGPPELYPKIATELSIPYDGKVLNEILKDRDLKSDPIHPNEKGYRRLAETIAALLKETGAVE